MQNTGICQPGVKASPKNIRNNSSAEMSPAKCTLHYKHLRAELVVLVMKQMTNILCQNVFNIKGLTLETNNCHCLKF